MGTRVKQEPGESDHNPLSHVNPNLIFAPPLVPMEPANGVQDASTLPGPSQPDANTDVVIKQEEGTAAARWIKPKSWLCAKWKALPAVPSLESRRAWAVARGIEPAVVHKWFHSKRGYRKRLGKPPHPQDGYELDPLVPQDSLILPQLPDKSAAPTPGPSSSSPPPQTPLDPDYPYVAMASGTPLIDDLWQDSPRAGSYSSAPLFNLPPHVPHPQAKAGSSSKTAADSGLLPVPKITIKLSLKRKQEELDSEDFDSITATPVTPEPHAKNPTKTAKTKKASKATDNASGSKPSKKKQEKATKVPEVKEEQKVPDMLSMPNDWNIPILLDQNSFFLNQPPNQMANPYPTNSMDFNIPVDPFEGMSYTEMLAAPFPTNNYRMNQFTLPDARAPAVSFTESQGAQSFHPTIGAQDHFSFLGSNFGNPNVFAMEFGAMSQAGYNNNPGQFWGPNPQALTTEYFLNQPLSKSYFQWP